MSETTEEVYAQAVADLCEARTALVNEELRRAEFELAAVGNLMESGQCSNKTEAKAQKALDPEYRQHKERVNDLENNVIRCLGILRVREVQMLRTIPPDRMRELVDALTVSQLNED